MVDRQQGLRMAAHRGDGHAIVDHIAHADKGRGPLQEIGTALLVALARKAPGAPELAATTRDELTARGWPGDTELADLLHARVTGVRLLRRSVPLDLEQLSDALEGDPAFNTGAFLELATGEVWPEAVLEDWGAIDDPPNIDAEPDRWLRIWPTGSRDGWRDMADFINDVDDAQLAARLNEAIRGRGAFARFRHVLDSAPDVHEAWLTFSKDRRIGRAREWLRTAGFDAAPPTTRGI